MQFELAIHKGGPDGIHCETAIQVACFLPLVDVDCLQDPSPVFGFLFKHLSFLPVHSLVVTVGMDRNPVLIILPHCILVFHNSLLKIPPCFTDVARVTIHARDLIHNVFLL